MNMDHLGGEGHAEKLDADAVCIQCNTVNAEGTLLCKVCGNNLRDQRAQRLNADQELETGPRTPKLRSWLSPVFFLLSVTLILSTLYNQDMIIDWMIGLQSGKVTGPEALWQGEESTLMDALVDDLQANLPSEEDALEARDSYTASPRLDGMYVLFSEDVYVGAANVQTDDEGLYFAALLDSGEQLRGRANLQGNYYLLVPNSGAIQLRNRMNPIQGVASPVGNGTVECVGDDLRERFSCIAYPYRP